MTDDRLEEPPFESLEERAGGRFIAAGDPGSGGGGGCSAGCLGCAIGLAVAVGAAAWFLLAGSRMSFPRPPHAEERAEEAEEPAPRGRAPESAAERALVEPPAGAPAARAEVEQDRALDAKIRAIRGAVLQPWRTVRDGMLTYHEWCDPQAGPAPGGDPPHGPDALSGVETAAQRIAGALTNGPETPDIDRAARRWVSALQGTASVLRDAQVYYGSRGFERDDFAEARELHPRLEKAWRATGDAQRALEQALHAEDVRLKASGRVLAALEGDPVRAWELRARRAMAAADDVLEAATVPSLAPPAERRAPLDRAVEALKRAATGLEPTPPPEGARLLAGLSQLKAHARELCDAASERAAEIAAPRAYTERELKKLKGPAAWQVVGTEARLRQRHERILEAYLRLRFD